MSVKAEIERWAGEWFTGHSLPHVSVRVFLATCMIGDRRSKESRRASESDGRGQHEKKHSGSVGELAEYLHIIL
jgi:hypothetical protein